MDFYNLLRSAEELLFELAMLIILFPRTIWRSMRHPASLEHKINTELSQEGGRRFDDMVSPPLCLLLSVALGSAMTIGSDDAPDVTNAFGRWIEANAYNDLIFGALLFCTLPLMFCWLLLRARRQPFNRDSVRRPFYLQACLVSPMALLILPLASLSAVASVPWVARAAGALACVLMGMYMLQSTRMAMRAIGSLWHSLWITTLALFAAIILSVLLIAALLDPVKLIQAA